ncbi:arginase family protein [Microbacterium laevaniformans]|uniref:Arginase family protein n=1 Tax=Microbacterium laevaniformans TaxID=36807 RepID=A0A4S2DBR1_9MICO|nr:MULTISPECIES: arginase family protein [Microbacterium]AXA97404.1 arginase [Microbacterium sp. PM5]MDC7803258.1 arginase family protein [Sphingomonas sp. BLCC-B65]TGY39196.1 arginase family protein [Microbacterium laevaniformans]
MTRFVVVPQWQGSPAARAMLLVDGAEAIAGDLPRAATARVEVPAEAGEALGTGVRRFSAMSRVADALTAELATGGEPALVVGGDCGIAVPAIAHAAARHRNLAVVWFDAHGDLHTPATSPSGAFGGMALRAACESGPVQGSGAVTADRVVLVGARDLDPAEAAYLAGSDIRGIPADAIGDGAAVAAAVAATGADAVYIHVDLDVLDPAELTGVTQPTPFGATLGELTAAIAAVRRTAPLVGASIAGFAPASPAAAVDDLGTILRVVGALA